MNSFCAMVVLIVIIFLLFRCIDANSRPSIIEKIFLIVGMLCFFAMGMYNFDLLSRMIMCMDNFFFSIFQMINVIRICNKRPRVWLKFHRKVLNAHTVKAKLFCLPNTFDHINHEISVFFCGKKRCCCRLCHDSFCYRKTRLLLSRVRNSHWLRETWHGPGR